MDEYMKVNRERWDELVAIHARSAFYDLEGFKKGRIALHFLEREELGDVSSRAAWRS